MDLRQEFESKLFAEPDYDRTVLPFVRQHLDASFEPPKTFQPIDVYGEILLYKFSNGQELPNEHLVALMAYRPFVYHVLAATKTVDEFQKWRDELIDAMPPQGERSNEYRSLVELLEMPIIEDCSPVLFWHYFIGLPFVERKVGIDKERLDVELSNAKTALFLHASSEYVYTSSNQAFGKSYITPEAIANYHPIHKERITERKGRTHTEKGKGEANYAVIDYCNGYYTVIDRTFTDQELKRMADGALPLITDSKYYVGQAKQQFLLNVGRMVSAPKSVPKLCDVPVIINECVIPVLDSIGAVTKSTINRFVSEVAALIEKKKAMEPVDLLLFKHYLTDFNLSVDWHKGYFYSYVNTYFAPQE